MPSKFIAVVAALLLLFPATASALAVATVPQGGTGAGSFTKNFVLLGNGTAAFQAVATSSLGLKTTNVTEGTNLYYTAARSLADFITNLAATTSVKSITTLPSLSLPYSQLTGTPTLFAYPFPSNATSTSIAFNGGLTGVLTGSLVGNASTATALASTPTKCSAGNYPLGVDASGNAQNCTAAASGGGSGNVATSTSETAGQLAYWTSTGATPALLGKVATSSGQCSSGASCSAFTVVGSVSPTITVSGLTTANFSSANISQWTNNSNYITLGSLSATTPIIYNSGSGAFTWVGLATTSQPASSNLLTSNGAAGVYGTATSTLTPSGPLTGGFTQVGSGGAIGCTTASNGVAGCLNSSDWATFNGKQAALTATWPQILTGATLSFGGLSTTTNLTQGQIPYVTGVNTFGQVATGTISAGSSAITVTAGRSAIGGALAIDCAGASGSQNGCLSSTDWTTFNGKENVLTFNTPNIRTGNTINWVGLATTSQPASSNLLVSNGAAGVYGVATSSETCSAPLSCTAHAVLTGGGAITIAQSSGVADGFLSSANFNLFNNKVATSASETAGQVAVWGTTSGTPPKLYSLATSTATCSTGLSCTGFNVLGSNAITFTNTGVTSNVAGAGIGLSGGTGAVTITNLIGYPFTLANVWGTANANSTSTITQFTAGLFASSTVAFGNTGLAPFIWNGAAGNLGIGATTNNLFTLTLASTSPQLSLSDKTNPPWYQWAFGSSLAIGTSSLTTGATTTPPAIFIDGTGPGSISVGSTTPTISAVVGLLTLGSNGANGSSTVSTGKFQFDAYNSAGTRICVFFNPSNTLTAVAGACNK